jgi:hypothetical protein
MPADTEIIQHVSIEERIRWEKNVNDLTTHNNNKNNPHAVTKAQVGLGNVTNDAQLKATERGAANGVASLDANTKIPVAQLPNVALTAETGSGTDTATPAVASNTITSILQSIWNKIRQLVNVIGSKQNTIAAGTSGRLLASSGTAGTVNELSSTVGSTQLPVYLNAGVLTALTQANLRSGIFGAAAVGSATQPVYIAAGGVPTVASIPDATTTEKGKALLGAANGAARFNQKADVGLGNVTNDAQLPLAGGTMTGVLTAGGTLAINVAQVRNIIASTTDLTANSSALATGQIYLVYE